MPPLPPLQVDARALQAALVTRKLLVGREVTVSHNRLPQAEEARDSLAKALYAGLFDWLVGQINANLGTGKAVPGER